MFFLIIFKKVCFKFINYFLNYLNDYIRFEKYDFFLNDSKN